MSGIYLIVWDNSAADRSPILKPTKGGYPHITLAYTGNHMDMQDLCSTAAGLFETCANRSVTCISAYVNSFEEKPGKMRHDVLLRLSEKDTAWIEELRYDSMQTHSGWRNFSMKPAHVTHGIYETAEEAEKVATALNAAYLPATVTVTGITID
jgi:hypothetical protein